MGTALMPKSANFLLIYGMVLLTYSEMQRGVVEPHMAALLLHREPTVTVPGFRPAAEH